MYSFGARSSGQLATAHHDLVIIAHRVIEVMDIQIYQGARTVEEQIRNVTKRVSKTMNSRHIPRDEDGLYDPTRPCVALDIYPYPVAWPLDSDTPEMRQKKAGRFYYMQGLIRMAAHQEGIKIVQGVDWDMDGDFFDQRFDDLPHVQLAAKLPRLVLEGDLLEMANEALLSRGLKAHA